LVRPAYGDRVVIIPDKDVGGWQAVLLALDKTDNPSICPHLWVAGDFGYPATNSMWSA
jgi:hypothetical protein